MAEKIAKMDEKIARSVIRRLLIGSKPLSLSIVQQCTGVSVQHLQRILELYPKNFKVIYGRPDVLVKLLVPVGICSTHSSKNKVCSGPPSCSGLHICKFYMVSDTCRFGNKCSFGHDLSTSHNVALLQQYLLDNIPITELQKMFQNSRTRTASTLPKICSFYNGPKGCRCSETGKCCISIHICRYYILDNCTSGVKCMRNHDVFDPFVKETLEKHGFDMHRTAKEILADLRHAHDCGDDDEEGEIEGYPNERGAAACAQSVQESMAMSERATPELIPRARQTATQELQEPRCTASAKMQKDIQETLEKDGFDMHRTAKEVLADLRHAHDYGDDDEEGETEGYPNERGAAACAQSVQESMAMSERATPELIPPARQTATQELQEPRCTARAKMQNDIHRRSEVPQQQSQQDCKDQLVKNKAALDDKYAQLERPASAAPKHTPSKTPDVKPRMKPIPKSTRSQPSPMTQTLGDECRDPDICIFHLQGRCQFGPTCRNIHCDLTYQWQIRKTDRDKWTNIPVGVNKAMELTYSDPFNSEFCANLGSDLLTLKFRTMTGATASDRHFEFRRLSTISAGEVEGLPLATEWRWYWLDEVGAWMEYGDKVTGEWEYKSNLSSSDLEQKYLANPTGQIEFVTSEHVYNIDFNRLVQLNLEFRTERKVSRRPVFATAEDIGKRKTARRASSMKDANTAGSKVQTPVTLPKHWNITTGEDAHEHFKQVKIKKTKKEYKLIEASFYETMPSTASITSILRVENGDLWLNYVSKRENMRKRNGDLDVDGRQLFHGTSTKYVNAICHQGFDCRLSGKSTGNVYGKGSYFALNAKYSNDFVDDQNRMMFVVRVLVGDFVKGEKWYVRPPRKNRSDQRSALYDSCVDVVENPSIFVVFEFNQSYPEYVIKYDMKY